MGQHRRLTDRGLAPAHVGGQAEYGLVEEDQPHWPKIWSTNPLERVNKEIKRRARVLGSFPNDAAVIRLVSAILADMHDEWQLGERRYLSVGSMAQLEPTSNTGGIAANDSGKVDTEDQPQVRHSAGHCPPRPASPGQRLGLERTALRTNADGPADLRRSQDCGRPPP